tara:strand:- start:456 stop:962 length:507 start_codon:yes stop_codon:yes gene_type:complete
MGFENILILNNKLTLVTEVEIKIPIILECDSYENQSFIIASKDRELIHIFIFAKVLTDFLSKDYHIVYERIFEKLLRSSKVSINNKSIFHQWNIYGLSYKNFTGIKPSSSEQELYYARSFERLNGRLNGNKDIIWKEYLDHIYYQAPNPHPNPHIESFNVSVKNFENK